MISNAVIAAFRLDGWTILFLIVATPYLLGYLVYCCCACLAVRAIAKRREFRFSVWTGIAGIIVAIGLCFLLASLASRSVQGPSIHREESGKNVFFIGMALAPW